MQISSKVILTFTAFICALASTGVLPKPSTNGLLLDGHQDDVSRSNPLKDLLFPMTCKYPYKTFTQLIHHPMSTLNFSTHNLQDDHSSNNTDTFNQQYQIIRQFHRSGGPILFYQGAESPLDCAEMRAFFLYAMELGAMVVAIEHRFFGQSWPRDLFLDNDKDQTVSALSSLTLENVLLDSVELVKHIKSTVPEVQDSQVIAFGGSYGATLVALLRMHFPDVFFAAFPSSGVFGGLVSDPRDPLVYAWSNWVRSEQKSPPSTRSLDP